MTVYVKHLEDNEEYVIIQCFLFVLREGEYMHSGRQRKQFLKLHSGNNLRVGITIIFELVQ